MICKELKNFGGNLFGIRKRLSLGNRPTSVLESDETVPLTEAMCNEYLKSSVETIVPKHEEFEDVIRKNNSNNNNNNSSINTRISDISSDQHCSSTNYKKLVGCSETKQPSHSRKPDQFQEDWSFTWYDFDGRGKITRKDMSTVMKSLYDIIRCNTRNKKSRFVGHYKLHLILMPADYSNVQGLDLATTYEQIYHVNSVMTSLTNLTVTSSDPEDQENDNTINAQNTKKGCEDVSEKHKDYSHKSFMERCFEELHEKRARIKEKRSKSTPTENQVRIKIRNDNIPDNSDRYSISTSLLSLAGSSAAMKSENKSKSKKSKPKTVKTRYSRKNSNQFEESNESKKTLSISCQNIENTSSLPETEKLNKKSSAKFRTRQQIRKYLGRKQVEEWLQNEDVENYSERNNVEVLHHHHHHYHYVTELEKATLFRAFPDNKINLSNKDYTDIENIRFQHHFHFHHHHHHYFY